MHIRKILTGALVVMPGVAGLVAGTAAPAAAAATAPPGYHIVRTADLPAPPSTLDASGQANCIAFDFGNQAARDVMVMRFMSDAAVGAGQLDPVALDMVDGANRHAVGADDFHMLTNFVECGHG